MQSRRVFLSRASAAALFPLGQLVLQERPESRTFVLVHGAWGGGWAWKRVSDILSSQGHRVIRVHLTGMGERVHLAGFDIGLATHISDVVNAFVYDELTDVTLVGHSYGGMVVTGAADQVPERIRRLVYLDAFVPEDGESLMGLSTLGGRPSSLGEQRGQFLVPTWVKPGTPPPADVPQPLKTFTDTIQLKNPARERIRTTYILTTDKGATSDRFDPFAARATKKGWRLETMTADHNPHRSAPEELCALFARIP